MSQSVSTDVHGPDQFKILGLSTDASEWASHFMQVVDDGVEVDEGLMLAWFAHCIETAKMLAVAKMPLPPLRGLMK